MAETIKISPDILQYRHLNAPLTLEETRRRYAPPQTLGCPEDRRMAMDAALADSGYYSLLQHTAEMGMYQMPQFMGYGALQTLAQNALIRSCISTVANDMTREWVKLAQDGDENEESTLVADLTSSMKEMRIQETFAEAVELAGYEGGSFIFIDTGETADLTTPLTVSSMSAELQLGGKLRFTVIDPVNCTPGNYNSYDPLRPDYFKPKHWWVMGRVVHASRLLPFVWNEVPILLKPTYNFFGVPQSQLLWDYVMHFQDCRSAVTRLLKKFSQIVFKTALFDSLGNLGPEQAANLDARINYMLQHMSNDGALVIDKDAEDLVKVETPLSGLTDIVRQQLEFLAAVNRTPAVKLLGISPSGFNATGESDIRNYYDHIATMQQKVIAAPLKTVLDCIQLHTKGEISPSVSFQFNQLSEEDKRQQAEIRQLAANTAAVYLNSGILSQEEVRQSLADDHDSGFSHIDVDSVPEPTDELLQQEQPENILGNEPDGTEDEPNG